MIILKFISNSFTNFLADWNLFLYFKVKVDEKSLWITKKNYRR